MAPSSLAILARIARKLERARRELDNLRASLAKDGEASEAPGDAWGRSTRIAAAVTNVFNGFEDILSDVARTIDGAAPAGPTPHQDLLDQMVVSLKDRRPALIREDDFVSWIDLKAFRHIVRHSYGIDLDPRRVEEQYVRIVALFPVFEASLEQLARTLEAGQAGQPTPS